MSENDDIEGFIASDLEKMFYSFCSKVIRTQVHKQVARYMCYFCKYSEFLQNNQEELCQVTNELSKYDQTIFNVAGEDIVIENEELAIVIADLHEKKRGVLFLNVMFGYSLKETAKILAIDYGSARVYKTLAIKEIRERMVKEKNENSSDGENIGT